MAKKQEEETIVTNENQNPEDMKAKFQEKLAELLVLGKKKKNILEYQEISDFFKDMNLDAEKFELVLDYLERNNIDVLRITEQEDDVNDDILLDEEDIAGIAITELGSKMFTNTYEKRVDPRGKVYYWMAGELTNEPADSNSDIAAVRNNKISITPVTYEMTKEDIMSDLESTLCHHDACEWM